MVRSETLLNLGMDFAPKKNIPLPSLRLILKLFLGCEESSAGRAGYEATKTGDVLGGTKKGEHMRMKCRSFKGKLFSFALSLLAVIVFPILGNGATIGDWVWLDTNRNGIQETGEPGIADVGLSLFDAAGALKQSTATDSNGIYSFFEVDPGTYQIQIDLSTLPAGYVFTVQNAPGSVPPYDSDFDSLGKSIPIILQNDNDDIDAGLIGTPIPEPATMLLLASGLVGLAGLRRKKFSKK